VTVMLVDTPDVMRSRLRVALLELIERMSQRFISSRRGVIPIDLVGGNIIIASLTSAVNGWVAGQILWVANSSGALPEWAQTHPAFCHSLAERNGRARSIRRSLLLPCTWLHNIGGVLTRFEVWIPASVFASIAVRAYQVRKVGGGGAAWYASKEAVGLGRDASPSSDDLRRLPTIL